MRNKRNIVWAVAFAAILLGVGCFGAKAEAQSMEPQGSYQGTFTLPFQAHWGKAVLPAGNYELDFASGADSVLVIRSTKTHQVVAFESATIRDGADGEASALLIGARGNQHVVHSFRIAELGETYIFDRALAHPRQVREARGTSVVPVLTARK